MSKANKKVKKISPTSSDSEASNEVKKNYNEPDEENLTNTKTKREEDDIEFVPVKKQKQNYDNDNKDKMSESNSKTGKDSQCTEIFMRNLSYKTTEEDLKAFFSKYGNIDTVKIVYEKHSGRPKGVAFVKFLTREDAQSVINDQDNMSIDGRPIQVSFSDQKIKPILGGKDSNKKEISRSTEDKKSHKGPRYGIFVGNLSFKTTESSLAKYFLSCGKVVATRIAKTPDGKIKGFAHVDFDTEDAVAKALDLNGSTLDGREIRVEKTVPRQ